MKPLNPANYPTYNVGDKVTIRQWDDMAAEFGLDEYGGIKVPKTFTMYMKKYCGQTLPIIHVNRYTYRNLNRNYPGSVFLVDGQVHVMQGVSGSHNGKADGYYNTNGNAYPYYKCKFVVKNEGIVFA